MHFNTYNFQRISLFIVFVLLIVNSLGTAQPEEKSPTLKDTTLAAEYFEIGHSLSLAAKLDSSNLYYEKGIKIYKELSKHYDLENIWAGFIRCSSHMCANLLSMGKYDSSLYLQKKMLEVGIEKLGENHELIAYCYYNLGKVSDARNNYDSSLVYYNKSLSIRQQLFGEMNAGVARDYIKIGDILNDMKNEFDKAKEYYEKSLAIGLQIFGEVHYIVAKSYSGIAKVFYYKGNYNKALDYFKKELSIQKRLYGEDHPEVANSYNSVAAIYLYKGDYDSSLENFQKSLSIYIETLGENHLDVSRAYNNIGLIYYYKGDYDKALETHQKSLSIRLKILGQNSHDVAVSYINLGNDFQEKKDYDKALDYYNKSLIILNKLFGAEHPEIAFTYNSIGDAYRHKKKYDKALEAYHKSLSIRKQLFGDEHPDVAVPYLTIGIIYRMKGDLQQALEYLQKSLSIWLKYLGENHSNVADNYVEFAEVYNKRNDFTTALSYCQKAINSLVRGFNNQSVYSNPRLDGISKELSLLPALKLKAKIFMSKAEKNGTSDLEMALSTYQLTAELIDKMRIGYKTEGSKLFLQEEASEVYDLAIQTSVKLYDITAEEEYKEQAFLFAEKSKSSVLLEELTEAKAKQFAKLPSNLLEEEKQLRVDLAFYNTRLQNEYEKRDSQDKSKVDKYKNRLFDLNKQYKELISDFEKNYPDYYSLKYQTKTISAREVQNIIPQNSVLLDYFVGNSTIYIFLISQEKFEIHSIKKPGDFQMLVKDFYSSISKSETKKYISTAGKLSEVLITPIIQEIKSSEKLVIIPHNLTYKIPFEALLTDTITISQKVGLIDYSKLNFLIKNFSILYHYSANLYVNSLKKNSKSFTNGKTFTNNFVGFAPVFAKDDLTGYTLASKDLAIFSDNSEEFMRSVTINGKRFNELKYSEQEIKTIIELLADKIKDKQNIGYFYSDATEGVFKSNISDYRIIHIATHSFINELRPQISGVVFAQPADTSVSEDGILYAGETYNLDLNADLVVLSSCESGLGKLIKGEGMMALTRGFLYSGANNIIFSLWKIPDKHTSELMIEFYKQMLSGKTYSESLRDAKLSLIENQFTARPRSWASFILVGSD